MAVGELAWPCVCMSFYLILFFVFCFFFLIFHKCWAFLKKYKYIEMKNTFRSNFHERNKLRSFRNGWECHHKCMRNKKRVKKKIKQMQKSIFVLVSVYICLISNELNAEGNGNNGHLYKMLFFCWNFMFFFLLKTKTKIYKQNVCHINYSIRWSMGAHFGFKIRLLFQY